MNWTGAEGKALYGLLFEEANDAVVVLDEQDRILDVNKQACRLYGYGKEEFLGLALRDLQASDRTTDTGKTVREEIELHGSKPFENVDITKDGRLIDVEVTNSLLLVEGNRIVFSIVRDITERKRRESEAAEALALRRAVVESPKNINIWSIDRGFRYTFFNMAHKTGMKEVWKADIRVGDNLLDTLTDPEYRRTVEDNYRSIFEGKQHRSVDKLALPGGGYRYYENFATPMRDSEGAIIGATVFATDITDRMLLEEELKHKIALLESIMNSPPDILILSVDREYRYTFFNKAHRRGMLEVWGTEPEIGKNVFDLLPDEEYRNEVKYYYDRGFEGAMWTRTSRFVDRTGRERYFDNLSAPVRDKDGKIIGLTVFITEVTERVKAEIRLKESLAEKEILLREVHHRVKNNLQIVSSLLNMQIARESEGTVIEQLVESQNRIVTMALIHEHLYESESLAKIDIGSYIKELAEVILRTYSLKRRNIRIEYDIEAHSFDIETSIPLGLIFNELLTNAVKYAFPDDRDGSIHVSFRTEGSGGVRFVCLEVADDGVGCDTSLLEPGPSSGLGLQIVDALAGQLGGTYESECGDGLVSRVRFPLSRGAD
ncbi:MAG: PAS domain S-box protein [Spirochaetia bacterium]